MICDHPFRHLTSNTYGHSRWHHRPVGCPVRLEAVHAVTGVPLSRYMDSADRQVSLDVFVDILNLLRGKKGPTNGWVGLEEDQKPILDHLV